MVTGLATALPVGFLSVASSWTFALQVFSDLGQVASTWNVVPALSTPPPTIVNVSFGLDLSPPAVVGCDPPDPPAAPTGVPSPPPALGAGAVPTTRTVGSELTAAEPPAFDAVTRTTSRDPASCAEG